MNFLEKIKNFTKKTHQDDWNLKTFTIKISTFGALHATLFSTLMIPFLKANGLLPLQLSFILVVKRITRVFFDLFIGVVFDRFDARFVFLLGRVLKICSLSLLLFIKPSFELFLIVMFLEGVSYSCTYGKPDSYIYNQLQHHSTTDIYPRIVSIYYVVMDLAISFSAFLGGFIFSKYGYSPVIAISIFTTILAIIVVMDFIPKKDQHESESTYTTKSFKETIITVAGLIKKSPQLIHLILMYGILQFFAWGFFQIASMIWLDIGFDGAKISYVQSINNILLVVGSSLPIFLCKKGINLRLCSCLVCFEGAFLLLTSTFYSAILLVGFELIVMFIFTVLEVSIEKKFEFFSDKRVRGTIVSVALSISNFIDFCSTMLIGFVAQKYSYRTAFNVFVLIMLILMLLNAKMVYNIEKPENK